MRSDLLIALAASLLIHGGLALGGHFWPAPDAQPAPAAEPPPPIEVYLAPPPEPDQADTLDYAVDSAGGPSELAAPQIADSPVTLVESPFVQRLQPPPPPGLPSTAGLIKIPSLGGTGRGPGSGLGNLFDLAALDQNPIPTFQPQPAYPYELRRNGTSGQVLVEFIVLTNGTVTDARAIRSSNPGFEDAALQAVRRWRFKPGTKDGIPVNTRRMQQLFTFNLENFR